MSVDLDPDRSISVFSGECEDGVVRWGIEAVFCGRKTRVAFSEEAMAFISFAYRGLLGKRLHDEVAEKIEWKRVDVEIERP